MQSVYHPNQCIRSINARDIHFQEIMERRDIPYIGREMEWYRQARVNVGHLSV